MMVVRGGGSIDYCDDLFLFLKPPSVLSLMFLSIPLGFSPFRRKMFPNRRKGTEFGYLTDCFISKGCLLLNSTIRLKSSSYREALLFN
ncbi:hypothetical protein Hanom_Chr04g00327031 [Helianthus anomalus]